MRGGGGGAGGGKGGVEGAGISICTMLSCRSSNMSTTDVLKESWTSRSIVMLLSTRMRSSVA